MQPVLQYGLKFVKGRAHHLPVGLWNDGRFDFQYRVAKSKALCGKVSLYNGGRVWRVRTMDKISQLQYKSFPQ
jgi:hypothetical protein